METLDRLRLISRALDAGHRAGDVVALDPRELESLVAATAPSPPPGEPASAAQAVRSDDPEWIETWLSASAAFDGEALATHFWSAWNEMGGLRFLRERIGPFLQALGQAWSDGRLHVSHEHYTSERLRDFLTRKWRPLADRARGPLLALACLPGELHCLALHMAALTAALCGCRISFLGADTPLEEIILAADQQSCRAVLVSVSPAYDVGRARRLLDALNASMQRDVVLVVGGSGRPDAKSGEIHLDDWEEFYTWIKELADQGDSPP